MIMVPLHGQNSAALKRTSQCAGHMFEHLVPQSTPIILILFMVIVETISNLIRPRTLAVRLTANIIAGLTKYHTN